MQHVLLSVIIPVYNQGQYIDDVLECFTDYHRQHVYELIFVNDGSTDLYTLSKLKELEDQKFTVLHQDNSGVCVARNNGIKAARGNYILPLDGDDKIELNFIYESIEVLEKSAEYDVVYCDGEFFGQETGTFLLGEFNLQRLMIWNYIHVSCVYRKTIWERIGGYDPLANGMEDWDLWLSIAFKGSRFFYLKKTYFHYRILQGSAWRSLKPRRRASLIEYIEAKHRHFMDRNYLNDLLIDKIKKKKLTSIKIVMRIFFPRYLRKLVRKGKVESIHII